MMIEKMGDGASTVIDTLVGALLYEPGLSVQVDDDIDDNQREVSRTTMVSTSSKRISCIIAYLICFLF